MRYRTYQPLLEACRDRERLREIVSVDTLIAARIEPGILLQGGSYGFDLTFARGDDVAVISGGLFDAPMIAEPECSPFVWPATAHAALSDAQAEGIEARLLPWVQAHMLGRRCNDELLRLYGDGRSRVSFERARAYGFLGAARYADVLAALSPYVLAARFARGRRVVARDVPAGASGAALVARTARHVRADLGEANDAARSWFGLDIFGALDDEGPYDVAIGDGDDLARAPRRVVRDGSAGTRIPVARAIPFDVGISFEPEDSSEAASLKVIAPLRALRVPASVTRPRAVGGSSGRILFATRSDFDRVDGADTDDARELAGRLRAEGFEVTFSAVPTDASHYDAVHAFSLPAVGNWIATAQSACAAGVPVVVTASADDLGAESVWGSGLSATLQNIDVDAAASGERRALFCMRKLEGPGLALPRQEPYPEYPEQARRALAYCTSVIARSVGEERFLRDAYGYRGSIVRAAPLWPQSIRPDWPMVVGDDDFVFCHAAIDRGSNLLALARAAMAAKLPLVIAGPAADINYLGQLRYMADEHTTIITNASAEQLEALYRAARVYADVAWYSLGPARQVRAAASGCALVLARNAYTVPTLSPGLWTADPADENAIAFALGDGWMNSNEPAVAACSQRAAEWADPERALAAVIAAYAAAQANVSAAVAENV